MRLRYLAALVDRDVQPAVAVLEGHGARVLEHLVAGDDAGSVRGGHAPSDAGSAVAEALVQRMLEGEAAAQAPAQPRDAPRAHGQVLLLRHAERDRLLVGRVAARAHLSAAQAVVAAEACALARADRAQLDAPVEPLAERRLEPAGVGTVLGLVREDEARAVEDELSRDRLQHDALLAHDVPEDAQRAPGLLAVRRRGFLVHLRGPPDDALERRIQLLPELVVGLHDPAELVPARRLADNALVPRELEASGIEGVHLPARGEDDADRDRHVVAPPRSRRSRTKSASSASPGWTLNSNERQTSRTVSAARSAAGPRSGTPSDASSVRRSELSTEPSAPAATTITSRYQPERRSSASRISSRSAPRPARRLRCSSSRAVSSPLVSCSAAARALAARSWAKSLTRREAFAGSNAGSR